MTTDRTMRRRFLIRPRLQLRLVLAFLSAACVATLVQVLLLAHGLSSLAEGLPNDGGAILERLPGMLRDQVLLTFFLMAPLMLAVGALETLRIAGPIHTFEQYLAEVARGGRPAPCRIREGDDLQELCRLLNEVTQPGLVQDRPESEAAQRQETFDLEAAPSLTDRRQAQGSSRPG
jgi:hypothetical protein